MVGVGFVLVMADATIRSVGTEDCCCGGGGGTMDVISGTPLSWFLLSAVAVVALLFLL